MFCMGVYRVACKRRAFNLVVAGSKSERIGKAAMFFLAGVNDGRLNLYGGILDRFQA